MVCNKNPGKFAIGISAVNDRRTKLDDDVDDVTSLAALDVVANYGDGFGRGHFVSWSLS